MEPMKTGTLVRTLVLALTMVCALVIRSSVTFAQGGEGRRASDSLT